MELQEDPMAVVKPLRGDLLLERDLAGGLLSERIDESGLAGDTIRRTGFDAVGDPAQGGLFYPHVTINWFEPGTSVELNATDWPSLSHFDGRFVALGIPPRPIRNLRPATGSAALRSLIDLATRP